MEFRLFYDEDSKNKYYANRRNVYSQPHYKFRCRGKCSLCKLKFMCFTNDNVVDIVDKHLVLEIDRATMNRRSYTTFQRHARKSFFKNFGSIV